MRRWTAVVAFLLFVGFLLPAGARTTVKNLILRQRVTVDGGAPYEETQYFSGNKTVRDTPQERTVVDLDAKTIMVLHKGSKTYGVKRLQDLQLENERQKARLTSLPAGAQKTLGIDEPATLKPTGKTQKIAGHKANEYAIQGGGMSGSIWVTKDINLGPGAYAWENAAGLAGGPRGGPGGTLADALAKLNGVPLRAALSVNAGPAQVNTAIEVLEVKEATPAADVFTVPGRYRISQAP